MVILNKLNAFTELTLVNLKQLCAKIIFLSDSKKPFGRENLDFYTCGTLFNLLYNIFVDT